VNPNKRFLALVFTISYHANTPITQFINPDLTSEERRELLRQKNTPIAGYINPDLTSQRGRELLR
jgi:hypothetical protein